MLRTVDRIACNNRWRNHSDAVALLCLGLTVDALVLPPLPGAPLVILAALLLAVLGAQVPLRAYGRAMLIPLGFLAVGSVGLCWSLKQNHGWVLVFSPVSAANALAVALRAWAATAVTLLFVFTTSVAQFMALLRRLHVPGVLVDLIGLTYRSLFILDEARAKVVFAQRSRLGYRSFSLTLRSSGQAAAALFVRTLMQSLRWQRGLYARGYQGKLAVLLPPTETRPYHLVFALGFAVALAGITWQVALAWSLLCHCSNYAK